MAKRICDPTSGKVGNMVYQGGRNGQVVRTRAIPSNPRSAAQRLARANLTTEARAWDALTEVKRLAWVQAAQEVQSRSRLGMSGPLTGLQLFVKINTSLLTIDGDVVDVPPAVPTIPALPIVALVITNPAGVVTLKLTTTDSPADGSMLRGAAPCRQGIARCPDVAFLGVLGSPSANAIDISTAYKTRFGTPAIGSKCFVQCNSNVDGWQDIPIQFSAIVPASS
jgi:hypothetical protein